MRVLTIGTFDLFHAGHHRLLYRANELGFVTVGVNSDRFVTEYKSRPPAEPQEKRIARVQADRFAREVFLNDGPGADLIEHVRPNLLVVGSDWLERDYLAQIGMTRARLDEIQVGVLFLPRTAGISSTELREAA